VIVRETNEKLRETCA